jgi:phenylacetate-CoA ligase
MAQHYDALETRTQEAREAAWMQALPAQVAHAQVHAPAFMSSLAGVKADEVNSFAALSRLPVVRKQELLDTQKASRAAGGGASLAAGWSARAVAAIGIDRVV